MSKEIHTDETILAFAIQDALNMFIRSVLLGNKIIDNETITNHEKTIDEGISVVIQQCVTNWKTSVINE